VFPPVRWQRLWLWGSPLLLCMFDLVLTLSGQSREYWSGQFGYSNEMNPQFNWLLQQHPAAFLAGGLVWIAVFTALIFLLPQRYARMVAAGITIGHAWGAATWLAGLPAGVAYWLIIALCGVSGLVLVLAMEWSADEQA